MRIVTLFLLATLTLSVVPGRSAEPVEQGKIVVLSEGRPDYSLEEIERISSEETPPCPVDGFYANPKLAALFSTAIFRVDGDGETREIPFRFRAPKAKTPGKRYPLIVVFHGKGESDDENSRQLAHLHYGLRSILVDPGAKAFLVAPQCPAGDNPSWYSKENRFELAPIDYARGIVDAMKRDFPIDPDRVSAFGICAGANAALVVAQNDPELFCALALTGLTSDNLSTGSQGGLSVPTWIFNNVDDDDISIEPIRKLTQIAKRNGASVYLTERTGKHDSWRRALRDDGVLTWLTTQRRGALLPPPPGRVVRTQRSCEETTRVVGAPLALFAVIYFLLNLALKNKLSAVSIKEEQLDQRRYHRAFLAPRSY